MDELKQDKQGMAIVVIHQPGQQNRTVSLADGNVEIGRDAGCAIVIDDPSVSRRHLRLAPGAFDEAYLIEDLQSRNGTWVNGRRMGDEPLPLHNGDRIHLTRTGVLIQFFTDAATITQQSPFGAGIPLVGPEALWVSGRWDKLLKAAPWLRLASALLGVVMGMLGIAVWVIRLLG